MNLKEIFLAGLAQQGGDPQSMLLSFAPLILIFVVMYFLMIRPQQKKQKEHRAMLEKIAVGDEVITNGGLLGKVTKVSESYLHLNVSANKDTSHEVIIQRSAVLSVLPAKTLESL